MRIAGGVHAEHASLLRRCGLRVTPQRLTILAAISQVADHFAVEDVHERVAVDSPAINVSTVYRTLESFEACHLVRRTDLGLGRIVYHWSGRDDHHHLVCHHCGTIVELESDVFEPFAAILEARYGFQANVRHQTIFGHCALCREHPALNHEWLPEP